jgi:hypothetical protein
VNKTDFALYLDLNKTWPEIRVFLQFELYSVPVKPTDGMNGPRFSEVPIIGIPTLCVSGVSNAELCLANRVCLEMIYM